MKSNESSRTVIKGKNQKSNITIQKETISLLNSTDSPSISIYPPKLIFPQIYPHSLVQKKILIPNSGMEIEEFTVNLTKGTPFSVPVTNISISPGQTYATLVTYNPKEVGIYNAMLVFDGKVQLSVPLSGTCVQSPLEIPPPSSDKWIFTSNETEQIIEFTNKDLAKSLSVICATDCQAFTVYPMHFEIASASSANVTIRYDPRKPVTKNPSLTIQCSQSGDSIVIPLTIAPPKPTIVVDFGKSVVNQVLTQTIQISSTNETPIVALPFSYVDNPDSPPNEMTFEFISSTPGDFQCLVKLHNLNIQLKATAIEQPFSLKIPPTFPKKPFFIHNTSDANISVSLSGKGLIFSKKSFNIPANSIEAVSAEINGSFDGKINVQWESKDGKFNNELSLQPTETTELLETESIIPTSSFQSKSEIKKPPSRFDLEPMTVETPFVLFPSGSNKFNLLIKGDQNFTIMAPSCIKVPSNYAPNQEIPIQVLSDENIFTTLEVSNDIDTISIPVISLNQKSNINIPENLKLTQLGQNYSGQLVLQNNGPRSAFVAFTAQPNSSEDVTVDPLCAIIEPNSKQIFDITSTGKTSIIVYSCDELIRQMRTIVSPNDYFAKCIENNNDELSNTAKNVIKMCGKKDILNLFKKNMNKNILSLETKGEKELITFTPEKLVFLGNEAKIANIINMSSKDQKFTISSSSPFVCIEPLSGIVPAYSSFSLKISLLRMIDASLTIKCGNTVIDASIICNSRDKTTSATIRSQTSPQKESDEYTEEEEYVDNMKILPSKNRTLKHEQKKTKIETIQRKSSLVVNENTTLEFPLCRPGTLRRAQLKIANKSKHAIEVNAKCDLPFSCPVSTFTIEGRSFVLFPVHFTPMDEGNYSAELILQTDNERSVHVQMTGECRNQ